MGLLSRLTFTGFGLILFTATLMIESGSCAGIRQNDIGSSEDDGFNSSSSSYESHEADNNNVLFDVSSQESKSVSQESSEVESRRRGIQTEFDSRMTECRTNDDCSPNYCCSLGMTRYAIPTCLPMGLDGDRCLPENFPRNSTLMYPNGKEVQVLNVYRITCPCEPSHFCQHETATCQRNK